MNKIKIIKNKPEMNKEGNKDEGTKGRRHERAKGYKLQTETCLLVHPFTCSLIINRLSLTIKH
jgi:hypothetical protein